MRISKIIALSSLLFSLTLIGCAEDEEVKDPTITSFVSSENTITGGSSIELTAEFEDGTATIDHGVGDISSGTALTIRPAATTTYLLTVTNSEGTSVTDTIDITVTGTSYDITVTNITNKQPLTPIAVVMHQPDYDAWTLGTSSTVGLEELAESGSPVAFITEAHNNENVNVATTNGAVTGSGNSVTITVTVDDDDTSNLRLSVASMLANTNDAFTGITDLDVSTLATGENISVYAKVYDAGTEANDEANIPGPAAGGQGFNTLRTSLVDKVVIHPGVVTTDDGLATSALGEADRWLTYAAKISITKTN